MKMTSSMGAADTAALVTVGDQRQTIRGETPDDVRSSIIATAQAWASVHGEAVHLESTEDTQKWTIQVGPDGTMEEIEAESSPAMPPKPVPVHVINAGDGPITEPIPSVVDEEYNADPHPVETVRFPASSTSDHENPTTRATLPAAQSATEEEAVVGRGVVSPLRPEAVHQPAAVNPFRRPEGRRNTGQEQTGSMRVMVANTAGGAGKTPTLIGVSQAMAARRGGEWVLVDLNPTGNLGEMAGVGHQAPLPELIDWLAANPQPTRTQLQQHVAWSVRLGCWIVTARETVTGHDGTPISGPGPTGEQTRRVLDALAEQFSLTGIDTGNNDLDWSYRVAAEAADRLVVATTGSAKSHAGALATVADLWDLGYHDLAGQAVVVNLTPRIRVPGVNFRRRGLDELGLRVVDVPFDRQVAAMRPDRMGRSARAAYARVADVLVEP